MTKKEAPVDAAMIERATRFDATIFLGAGKFRTEHFDSLAEARSRAPAMVAEVNNGRRAMIYAITAEGRSTFVPDSYQPSEGAKPMELAANLSALDIAKLTAVMTGGGYKRANSKEAAIKRFRNVATEHSIEDADHYLAGDLDFDTAHHVLFERVKGGHASIPEAKAAAAATEAATGPEAMEAKAEATTKPRTRRVATITVNANGLTAEDHGKIADAAAKAAAEIVKVKGKRAQIVADAEAGILPPVPDFSAETHKRFRSKLAEVVKLVEAGDVAGLEAFKINPISSSPRAMDKYRNLAVTALKARADLDKADQKHDAQVAE